MKKEKILGSWWWPQVDTGTNAHDPPLRAHDPAFDHNTCRFKCYILSMNLCPWPCALRVTGSSCWKTDVANLVTVLVTLPLRLALEITPQVAPRSLSHTKNSWFFYSFDGCASTERTTAAASIASAAYRGFVIMCVTTLDCGWMYFKFIFHIIIIFLNTSCFAI
jgi:hypothetical protein